MSKLLKSSRYFARFNALRSVSKNILFFFLTFIITRNAQAFDYKDWTQKYEGVTLLSCITENYCQTSINCSLDPSSYRNCDVVKGFQQKYCSSFQGEFVASFETQKKITDILTKGESRPDVHPDKIICTVELAKAKSMSFIGLTSKFGRSLSKLGIYSEDEIIQKFYENREIELFLKLQSSN